LNIARSALCDSAVAFAGAQLFSDPEVDVARFTCLQQRCVTGQHRCDLWFLLRVVAMDQHPPGRRRD
jgi:hypothetical protein